MNWLNGLFKNQKGVFLVFTAVLLPIIFACAGLAMDLGNAFAHKSKLQNAADAAVLVYGKIDYGNNKEPETAEKYMQANGAANKMYKITERPLTGTGDANSVLLSLYASEDVPTTFMRMFGFDKVPVSVVATCKVQRKKDTDSGVFKYAFIAGDDHDSYTCGDEPSIRVINNGHRIIGPVHTNGAVGVLYGNVDHRGIRNLFVDKGNFSTSMSDDLHLWNSGTCVGDWVFNNSDKDLHKNDILFTSETELKVPPNAYNGYTTYPFYLYQNRMGYYDGTNWGEDVTQKNSTYGTSKINISLNDKEGSGTKAIYDFIEDIRQNYKQPNYEGEAQYGGARDIYTVTNWKYGDWVDHSTNAGGTGSFWGFQYHTFIVDGDISVNANQIRWDKQPVVIISLHGNVTLALDESVKALIYAPNGKVSYKNAPGKTFEGSIVGKYIELNAQTDSNDTVNLYKWNDFDFPNLNRDNTGSGSSSGGGSSSDTTGTIGKVTLHADQDSNYGNESTLWGN